MQGHCYHVFNRCIEGQNIFHNSRDYLYLLGLLRDFCTEYHQMIIAYCLMPNHYHLLVKVEGDADISAGFSKMWDAYVKTMNKKYQRRGRLFVNRFKAILIDRESYLLHVCRYIHCNPQRAGLVSKLEDWPFSNYLDVIGARSGQLIDLDFWQYYYPDRDEYILFVNNLTEREPEDLNRYKIDV